LQASKGGVFRISTLGHLGERMPAQDITEEVFLKAWKAIDSCKGKEHTFSAWLYRIAYNHLVDYLRKRRKLQTTETRAENLADIDDVGQAMELKLQQQQLLEAISGLPDNQRHVIILKFIEGMDNREISQTIGKSEGNIRVIQMRALRTLRHRLRGEK
ncbi:RNA polymerase sigma factor, partial [Chloroflexota bacterium]